jgi:hypothetical protein
MRESRTGYAGLGSSKQRGDFALFSPRSRLSSASSSTVGPNLLTSEEAKERIMNFAENTTQPEFQWRWRLLLWAVIAIAFTSWSIQYSYQHGRLIGAPGCDDVGYFCDGLDRIDALYLHGWKGLIRSYVDRPPHSPFSTSLATATFGLFGIHEWAPYAGNGLIVFLLIAFTEWLLLGAKLWLRIAGLALVLTVPLSQKAVIEFRPDVAVAVLTAMGAVMAVTRSLMASSFRYRCLVGLVFGLAFLVKPTMCILTGFLWGLSLGAGALCDWYLHRPAFRKLLASYGLTALITVVAAAPYYLWNGKHVFNYIYRNIFGSDAGIWQLQATRQQHLLYYLSGPGAMEMVDNSVWILGTAILFGAVYILARRDREGLVRMAALTFCMLGAFAVPTISACKHGFYGLSFFCIVVFAALLSLREIYMNPKPVRPAWRWITSVVLVGAIAIMFWQDPHVSMWGTRGDSRISTSRQTCGDLIAALVANQQEGNSLILATAECQYANHLTMQWVARRDGRQLTFRSVPMGSDLETYRRGMATADFTICFHTERPMQQFASERMATEILTLARTQPYLVEVQSFPSFDGVVYYLFKNKHNSFTGWKSFKNLGPVEGPFPNWGLPRVRWGLGTQTRLQFDSKQDAPMRLSMSCRSGTSDQVLTVLLDGKEIFNQSLPGGKAFTAIDFLLPVLADGEHELTLAYSASDSSSEAARSLSVLFDRLQILPVTDKTAVSKSG